MKLAVISDIHANDVALRAALHDAVQCGVDVCASLGDIVGYGPSPVKSVHLAHDSFTVSVLGNHDAAVCGLRGISDFSDYAAEAVRVQRRQLGVVERTYLKLLPLVWNEGDVAMTHGDFTAPGEFRYIDDERAAAANFAARPERIMFVGHTHQPCVWMLDEMGLVTMLPAADFKLLPNRRYIINPGTVGYPRGGVYVCSTYVIYDDEASAVYFRKVPFDMNAYSSALRTVGCRAESESQSRRARSAVLKKVMAVLGVVVLGLLALLFHGKPHDKMAEGASERKYVEVVTTNRVIQVVDKVTITNYVIEVWANGVLKSSRTLDKPPHGVVAVSDSVLAPFHPIYCVIDLSSGPDASSYPVTYMSEAPSSWFNVDEYKTTKLVLRLIRPGSFKMCGRYYVTLTKPFFCGVFEVTQRQYYLVMGSNPSKHRGDKRPVQNVSYNMIRGLKNGAKWPESHAVDAMLFLGRLRARTGLEFDLPTEAQWEYACRAGANSLFNNGGSSGDDLKKLGRYSGNTSDGKGGFPSYQTTVGSYEPNAWGLYDMHGNVFEWCLDWHGDLRIGVVDPFGPSTGRNRAIRGGSCFRNEIDCRMNCRQSCNPSSDADEWGFRLFRTVSNGEAASIMAMPLAKPSPPPADANATPPTAKDLAPEYNLPYRIIDSLMSLKYGGAFGGDEVRIMKNPNGTYDIVHLFTEPSKTKTFVVPKGNRIEPRSGRFLLVAGGGASLAFYNCDGGAGGVVEGNGVTLAEGTSYVCVGNGGLANSVSNNGDDSILTLCGKTYVAIGGGGGGGYSGGSGGTGGGLSGVSLQPVSPSGGVGKEGSSGVKTDISGEEKTYALSGAYARRLRLGCEQNSGSGKGDGRRFRVAGGSGIAIIRYTIRLPIGKFTPGVAVATFPQPDAKVRSAVVNGITWRYFVENGTAVIGCHGEGSLDFPDLWLPAVDPNSLEGVVQIPDRIAGMRVAKIGKGAFQGCWKVTKFIVHEGVTLCGARAFARCGRLESVVYPRTLKSLGEGQVFRSQNVKRLCFQSPPPASITGRCPFKGCEILVKASIVVSTPFVRQWRMDDGCLPHGLCKDGCHKITCLSGPSTKDMELSNRTFAGFIGKDVSWKSIFSDGLEAAKEHIVTEVEDVWRNYDSYSPKRKLSLPSVYVPLYGIPSYTVKVYVSTMFFKAHEPVYFKYMIDDTAMVMIDNEIVVWLSQDYLNSHSVKGPVSIDRDNWHVNFHSAKEPVSFDRDGWHRIAIIAANGGQIGGATYHNAGQHARARSMLGGVYYSRGNDKNWRMFEVTPDGKEFRVGPEDARRAIADIERAKQK